MKTLLRVVALSALVLAPVVTYEVNAGPFNIEDVNPDTGSGDPVLGGGRNTSSGGRANNLAIEPGDPNVLYAASEYGGLWKTLDGGDNWSRLEGYKPFVTSDVAVDPGNTGTVYATSLYDGRTNSLAGIAVSNDGGASWTKPADTIPPASQCSATRRSEPSAFGIGVDPAAPGNVYIGTNCGLAISSDSGANWTHATPSGNPSEDIRDVVAHSNGTVDVCGTSGHYRSTDSGVTWTAGVGLPGGACSITVSPLESTTLHATAANQLWESRDATNWNQLTFLAGNRPRWVVDGPSTGASSFVMYYGDGVKLRTRNCDDSSTPRCAASDTDQTGNAHDDVSDIEFDGTCPRYLSSDGGVYSNGSCPGGFAWNRAMGGYRALWTFGFGASEPVAGGGTSLHIGMQDNGYFSSADGGTNWQGNVCCDGFDNVADTLRTVYSICCYNDGTRFFVADADNPLNNSSTFGGGTGKGPNIGAVRSFSQLDSIDQYGPQSYVMTTTRGVFATTDEGASWTQLGTNNPSACGVVVSTSSTGSVTFYAKSGDCNGAAGSLWKYSGTATGGTWTRADSGLSGVGIFAVDSDNPNRLYAADLAATPRMVFSIDGGATWQQDTALDTLMTGGGTYKYTTLAGPSNFGGRNGYSQPSLVAFDPNNDDVIFAGAIDSGLFATADGGSSWVQLADDVPRPFNAYFSELEGATYIATQGRGVLKVTLANADLQITKSDSPDPVYAGDQLYYTITVSNLGPDAAQDIVVRDQLPEEVTFITDDENACTEIATDVLQCDFGDLDANAQRSTTIKVKVDSNVLVAAGNVTAKTITNTASVSSGRVDDPDVSNNEASEGTIVEDSADLSVVKICKPDRTLDAGQIGFCEIFVDNLGLSDARDVEVVDELLGDAEFSVTSVTSTGASCNPTSGGGSDSYTVICTASSLAAGEQIKVTVNVSADDAVDINDLVQVFAATPDPLIANNRFEGSISVESVADLALAKTGDKGSVIAGENLVYTLTATNAGPSEAVNVVIEDNLPAGVEIVSVSSGCAAGVPGDPFQPTICNLGTIADGASANAIITVRALPQTRGTLINSATVTSDTVDRVNANNNASTSTVVASEADLAITKTVVQNPVVAGETLDYELQVVNNGPSSAFNVIVRDTLPTAVGFVGVTLQDVDGSCNLLAPPATNVVECHIGELTPNATTPAFIKIKTLVRADTPVGQIVNSATVESTDTPETDPSDNTDQVGTSVVTVADVSVDKITPFDTYEPSSQIIYTVNVTNLGPSDAQNVEVTDQLPLTPKKVPYLFDTGSAYGCTYNNGSHSVTCNNIPTLAAGEAISFNIHVKTKGNVGDTTNVLDGSSDTDDSDLTNNHFELTNLTAGGVKENGKGGKGGQGGTSGGAGSGDLLISGMTATATCDLRDLEVTFSWLPDQASPVASQALQVSLYPNQWNASAFGVSHMPAHARGRKQEAVLSNLETGTVYYWRVAGQDSAGGIQRFETPFCVADMVED